jgi:hypothetical protein
MDLTVRVVALQLPVEFPNRPFNIVSDCLGRTRGDDRNDTKLRITLNHGYDALLEALDAAKDGRFLMQGGGCYVKVFLEVLSKKQPHKHTATLAAVNQGNAVLYSNSRILCAAGLAVENGIDDAGPFLLNH